MATDIIGSTIATTYHRMVLRENGNTIGAGTDTVNIEIQEEISDGANAFATPLYLSTDRIGIGTASPLSQLHMEGNNTTFRMSDVDINHTMTDVVDADTFLLIGQAGTNTGGAYIAGYSNGVGNIGLVLAGFIGSNNPTDTVPAVQIRCGKDDGSLDLTGVGNDETAFQVSTSNGVTDFITVLGSGNVGIGTITPTYDFEVKGGAADDATTGGAQIALVGTETSLEDDDDLGTIYFVGVDSSLSSNKAVGAKIMAETDGVWDNSSDNDAPTELSFWTTSSDSSYAIQKRMSIASDGKVGITSAAPAYHLDVVKGAGSTRVCRIKNSTTDDDNADCLHLTIARDTHTGGNNNFIVFADGGGTADTIEGDNAGGINFTGEAEDTYSDSRLKTDIADLGSSLGKINSLKPRTYSYTDEFKNGSFQDYRVKDWQKIPQVGFIAQELGEVFPDLIRSASRQVQYDNVSYDGEVYNTGDMVNIKEICWGRRGNAHLLAHLIKAVQELSAKVTALENA